MPLDPAPVANRMGIEPRDVDLTPIQSKPPTKAEKRFLKDFFAAERAKNDRDPEIVAFRQRFNAAAAGPLVASPDPDTPPVLSLVR